MQNILFHLKESSQHNIWKKLNHAVKQGGYLIIDHESANTDEVNKCFTEKGKLRKTPKQSSGQNSTYLWCCSKATKFSVAGAMQIYMISTDLALLQSNNRF